MDLHLVNVNDSKVSCTLSWSPNAVPSSLGVRIIPIKHILRKYIPLQTHTGLACMDVFTGKVYAIVGSDRLT